VYQSASPNYYEPMKKIKIKKFAMVDDSGRIIIKNNFYFTDINENAKN